MQSAKLYMNHVADCMENALSQMPSVTTTSRPLPSSTSEINRYVEQLLNPTEQAACDMATD